MIRRRKVMAGMRMSAGVRRFQDQGLCVGDTGEEKRRMW
jgi:hypothetical protein